MYVRSADELREALRIAEVGTAIELAPGEYRGPFVIRRPLSLIGQDRLTVLWQKDAPAVCVAVAGVELSHLLIERTVTAGAPLIHYPNCEPNGQDSMDAAETLLNLGELAPGYTLTLPLELDVASRTEITVMGLYGAQVVPTTLETPGTHLVTLTIDGKSLQRGEMLLGEISLKANSGTRYLWISASVLDAPLPEQHFALATKKSRLYPSENGLILDGTVLSALEGAPVAGRFGFVQRDQSGNLALYVQGQPTSELLLNDRPLSRGTRVLLREHDAIKVSRSVLTVQPVEPPPLTLQPAQIIFKDFDANFPEPITLHMKAAKGSWVGQLLPTVRWLTVTPAGTLRHSGTKPHLWQIGLTEAALSLPNGLYEALGGLLLIASDHIISLDVRLNVKRPAISLSAAAVDAGELELGWDAERTVEVQIANYGRSAWMGTLKSNTDWLEVLTPMPISGEPWSVTPVQVRVSQPAEAETGPVEESSAFTLFAPDGTTQAIPAKLLLLPAQGHLEIVSTAINFDQVERGAEGFPQATLTLRNVGGGVFTGTVGATAGWVTLSVNEFVLLPDETRELIVELTAIPDELQLNQPLLIDEIQLNTGEIIPVNATLVELLPHITASAVHFAPFVKGDPPPDAMLVVHNRGPSTWHGALVPNVPWLTVSGRPLLCEAGEAVQIPISLSPTASEVLDLGMTKLPNAITITGGRESASAMVTVDLREAANELVLETPTINFGQVNGGGVELPTDFIRVLNASSASWQAKVEVNVPWLALEQNLRHTQLDVPRNSMMELKIILNEDTRALPPGLIADDSAIVITASNGEKKQRMTIRALLMMIEWGPVLAVKPSQVLLSADQTQVVSLRNLGRKPWQLAVSAAHWLEASPDQLLLDPGKESTITIKRKAAVTLDGNVDDPRAIVIIGQGREIEIRVSG